MISRRRPDAPPFVRLLRLATALYLLVVLCWQVLPRTAIAHWWIVQLLAVVDAWIFLPLPLIAALLLLWRQTSAVAWLAIPLLLLAWEYAPLYVPRGTSLQGKPLRIMTANLLVTNADNRKLDAVLAEQQPEVIAVQELGVEMAGHLSRTLSDRFPYQALYPGGIEKASLGIGLLSRYPIRAETPPEEGLDGCSCQKVTIDLDGQAVTIVNVHPVAPVIGHVHFGPLGVPTQFNPQLAERGLRTILGRLDTIPGPMVLLGDLNTSERQPFYPLFRQRLHDAFREAGSGIGYTYPSANLTGLPPIPFIRIDYIFHDNAWATRSAWTGYLEGSDHLFVVADLVLR